MIKVGLCDDITDYNKKMENYIIRYGNENHIKVKITAYGENISPRFYWNQIREGLREEGGWADIDRKSTRLNSSHANETRMPCSA